MTERFFTKINYAASNEDSASELHALRLTDSDTVLCITGSGARPLDLLTASPKKIVCIDFNPAQSHLLNLKIAAWRTLDYDDFCSFVGLGKHRDSDRHFSHVAATLASDSRDYWLNHRHYLRHGLLYCGTWERLLAGMSRLTVLRRRHVRGLLESPDLRSQHAYWQRHWTGSFLKNLLRMVFNRFLWTSIIREPGAKLIDHQFDVACYLYDCLDRLAQHSLLRENPYANLLFYGRYTEQCELPLHLRVEHFQLVKQQLDKLEVITAPLDEFLSSRANQFDAFSLSDFSSYAPAAVYDKIWQSVAFAGKPHARFCERFFLVKRESATRESLVVRHPEIERQLARQDHTCLYTFAAGHLQEPPCN